MNTHLSNSTIGRTAAIGLAGLIASITVMIPGVASAQASEPSPRLERACLRIPNLETRTTNLIDRLEGDASAIGSLAWLHVQIDRATASNRAQLAEVLTNRLAVRTATLDVLKLRLDQLPELRQFCIDHGVAL